MSGEDDRTPGTPERRFETERLILRDWREADAEAAFRIYGDPEVARWLSGTAEASLETQRASLRERIERQLEWGPLGYGAWAMVERNGSDQPLGTILLKPLPPENRDIEIGWHVERRHWGRGYAGEGARPVVRHAFEALKLDVLRAVMYDGNDRSRSVALKLGFRHIGPTEHYYCRLVELYELGRKEWLAGH